MEDLLVDAFHGVDVASQKKQQVFETLEKLRDSSKVQDSSAKIMSFLVQDFLDYAQIRSGKFRTNIRNFNILDMVESVMCIQRDKAEQSGIEFTIRPVNIDKGVMGSSQMIRKANSTPKFSPFILTDEQRVM